MKKSPIKTPYMFLDSLFKSIGSFFKKLFEGAQHAFEQLEPAVQDALKWGSGVVSVINNFVAGPAGVTLLSILKDKFPDLPTDKLLGALQKVGNTIGQTELIVDGDLEKTLSNLQQYLSSLSGTEWAFVSDTIAKGISTFTAPDGTKYSIISSLMESVYQRYFKKDKVVDPPVETA